MVREHDKKGGSAERKDVKEPRRKGDKEVRDARMDKCAKEKDKQMHY